jgi:hypothetical protein
VEDEEEVEDEAAWLRAKFMSAACQRMPLQKRFYLYFSFS